MRNRWLALGLVALACAACGDDDDAGGKVSSGLPATEPLSDLSDSEATRLCEAFGDAVDGALSESDRERITCTSLAIPLSVTEIDDDGQPKGDPVMCQKLVDRCLDGESISDDEDKDDISFGEDEVSCENVMSSNLDGCDATVRQFESCMSALLGEYEHRFDLLNCKALSDLEGLMKKIAEQSDFDASSLPACKVLVDKCPELEL